MGHALVALLLALAASVASAQNWVSPADGKARGMITAYDTRTATVPGVRQVEAARFVYSVVPRGSVSFQWALLAMQENYADAGDQVTVYAKQYKYGPAAGWAGVFETQDLYPFTDGSNSYGVEVDYMGARGRTTTGAGILLALGRSTLTVGRDPSDTVPSRLDYALKVTPYFPDWGYVALNTGLRFDLPCDVACLAMQGGSAIKFSDDPLVPVHRFDPPTGYVGYWRGTGSGRVCIWCFHALSGTDVRTNWTVP